MKKQLRIIILSVLILAGFSFQSRNNEDIYIIPLAKNISGLSKLKCSQFIDRFDYIQLETNERCLIPDGYRTLILKNHILVYSVKFCYIFDRKTGKFICEGGKYGRGPEEYQNALLAYDYTGSVIYSGGLSGNVMMFGIDGKYIGSFPLPPQTGGLDAPSFMTCYCSLQNSCIVGYYANIIGNEKRLLTVFNQKGEIIKVFPNRNVYPKRPLKMLDLLEGRFYYWDNSTYFKERANDTVFKVTQKTLIPHVIFAMGKFSVPYEYKWWLPEERKKADLIVVNNIFENSSWIHVMADKESVEYFALYNKRTRKLTVSDLGEGIPNDIDNFIPFKPENVDEEGNLVEFIDAIEINKWFKSNPSAVSDKIKGLQNIDINQNPVVIIGKSRAI